MQYLLGNVIDWVYGTSVKVLSLVDFLHIMTFVFRTIEIPLEVHELSERAI